MYEIGVNFAQIDTLVNNNLVFEKYIEMLFELNVKVIRIPLYWRRLITYETKYKKENVKIENKMIDTYMEFFSKCPRNMEHLGCIVNCSPHVAREYYHDQSVFSDYYTEYIRFVAKTFPFLSDIELWNEPNASDFYLSVPDRSSGATHAAAATFPPHRPWSGAEFVRDVIIPGTTALRQSGFAGGIVGVTFAENGLVGHLPHEKPAAFANTLTRFVPEFAAQAKENVRIGAFYFKPDFAIEVFDALRDRFGSAKELPFDRFGIHPYPYFKVGQTPFWKHSVELVDSFYKLQDQYGYSHVPVWATEVGIRSVDLHNNYIYDAEAQKAFVHPFAQDAGFGGERLQRIYWYKYQDQNWDLQQQKTFGLVDHYLKKKPVYYAVKAIHRKVLNRPAVGALFDDFQYGLVHTRGATDPDFWSVDKSEQFAYAVCSRPMGQEDAHLLIYPGRSYMDWFAMTTLGGLPADGSGKLSLDLDFRLFPQSLRNKVSFSIEIAVNSMEEPGKTIAAVRLLIDPATAVVSARPVSGDGTEGPQVGFGGVKPGQLAGVSIRTVSGNLCIFPRSAKGKERAEPLFALAEVDTKCSLCVQLTFRRVAGPPGFLELKRFRAERPMVGD